MQSHLLVDPLLEAEPIIRALVVADDPLVRAGFVSQLGAVVAGQLGVGQDVPAAITRNAANVVVWDLGPTAQPETPDFRRVGAPVLALASNETNAMPLLASGAMGVLRRDVTTEALHSALDTIRHGLIVVDPRLAEHSPPSTPGKLGSGDLPDWDVEPLTSRETEVLELVAAGLSNKQIAEDLGISAHTVKFHVNAILNKLDVHSRTEAVVRAMQLGVVVV